MSKKLLSLLLLFLVATSANAATTITFEELGLKGCCFDEEPPLTNQYAGSGVNFSGGWELLNQSGNFGVNALSGEHFAAYNTSVAGVTDTLEILFDISITEISGYLGSLYSGDWIVTAYSGANQLFSTVVSNSASSYVSFSLMGMMGLNVDKITIQGSALYGVLDDLTFQTVPIPAAVWLFGCGVVGLIGFSGRRKISA